MYGNNFAGYGGMPQQPQQQYPNPAAQRAYQQIGSAGYPQQYQQPMQVASPGFTWVQGEAAARSFMVAPGATVLLMDSESMRFYIKSADQAGMPSMRIFEYLEIDPARPAQSGTVSEQYVTRSEYEAIVASYQELADKINKILNNDTKRRKVVSDNEESVV